MHGEKENDNNRPLSSLSVEGRNEGKRSLIDILLHLKQGKIQYLVYTSLTCHVSLFYVLGFTKIEEGSS